MSLVLRCLWLMEHQKPILAQCDAFLRTWVCQGHINIINEQEADWSETEWQKEGEEANRKAIFIFVSNMMYIYLWFDDDCLRAAIERWRHTLRPGISCDYLPSVGTNGWQHLFFLNPFGKSHLPLLFHAQWQRTRKCIKETSPLIYVKTAIFIWIGYVALCWA